MAPEKRLQKFLTPCHSPDLSYASDWSWRERNLLSPIRNTTQIWVVTRHPRSFLRSHFMGKQVVASRNVGCSLRLNSNKKKTRWAFKERKYNDCLITYQDNWKISRTLIGQKLCSIRVQTVEMKWQWRIVFILFLALVIYQETSPKMHVKTFSIFLKKQIDNNFSWSLLLSTIETTKCSILCSWVFNILTSFLWSIGVQIMENCCQLLINEYFTCPPTAQAATIA